MDKRFLQDGFEKKLQHVLEECGEVVAAGMKLQRWGKYSYNPDIPREQRETNIDWVKRELFDLEQAIKRLKEEPIFSGPFKTPSEWEKEYNTKILDPDGWRFDNKDFHAKICEDEWSYRMSQSTIEYNGTFKM